jgi:hypothetical protein
MPTEWVPISSYENGFACDFCEEPSVGFVKVRRQNRSLDGVTHEEPRVYVCCVEHMKLAGRPGPYGAGTEAVYPRWIPDDDSNKGRSDS